MGIKGSDWFAVQDLAAEHTIRCVGVERHYQRGEETVRALDGIDLVISRGEYVR